MKNPSPKIKEDVSPEFNYKIAKSIKLVRPIHFKHINFWDVVAHRKSVRTFQSVSLETISEILWTCAKVKSLSISNSNYILTHRPTASAGARHPIDILIYSSALASQDLFYYNPFDHSLNQLIFDHKLLDSFLIHVNQMMGNKIETAFWFVAHFSRTEAKYTNAQSLVWRDAGALINAIQLASIALNIGSCPLGTLGEPYISKLLGKRNNIYGVGGILLG